MNQFAALFHDWIRNFHDFPPDLLTKSFKFSSKCQSSMGQAERQNLTSQLWIHLNITREKGTMSFCENVLDVMQFFLIIEHFQAMNQFSKFSSWLIQVFHDYWKPVYDASYRYYTFKHVSATHSARYTSTQTGSASKDQHDASHPCYLISLSVWQEIWT